MVESLEGAHMHVLVRTPVGSTGGYARDGQGLIHALIERGHGVTLDPVHVSSPISPVVAELLTYPTRGKFDLEIHHVPPSGSQPIAFSRRLAGKRVLWSMWEWDTFPTSVPGFDTAKASIKDYDQVVGYTQQTLDAFDSQGFLANNQETSVVQGGFEASLWQGDPHKIAMQDVIRSRASKTSQFKFAMVGVLAARKNPYTVIKAFQELKDSMGDDFNAELILKTTFPVLPPTYNYSGVRVVKESEWSDEEMREFYYGIDCLVNCAWGEGKDLPALEAAMCGTPVLLNNNPGHAGWNHPAIQKLLPSTTIPMDKEYVGRFTSKDDIKEGMLNMYNDRVGARRIAQQMSLHVGRSMTWGKRLELFGKAVGYPL